MIPAVIYARFSSHSQTEQSIEGQLAACYAFAEREGYTVIGEYIDRAISARTDDRPDFQRMIADSSKHTFEVILVYQLDRFSRNRYDSAVNKQKLKKNGVRVVSARENITADASGVLMEAVLEGMAEYYSAELAQKIRRGMDINGAKCLATGGRPALGYRVDETRHYQIDEQTAPTVVKIFEMYVSGMTVAQITSELNRLQIKTSTGTEFNKNSLRKMLTNKRYIGIYTYKGTETPGGIPRIVSDELFFKVADMMEKNKKAPARARAKEEYLLTTKLFCGHCKEMMTGISGTSKTGVIHNYYTCNGRKKKLCNKKNVQKDFIEDRVIELARAQLTDKNIAKIAQAVAALCEKEKENGDYKRLDKLRRDTEKQKANLVDALKFGKATETLLEEISKLEASIEGIDRQIVIEKAKCLDLTEPEITFFLKGLRNGDINDITYRRALIAVMVNAIYLYDDGRLTVIFNSSDKPVEVTESLLGDIEADAEKFVFGSAASTTSLRTAYRSQRLFFFQKSFLTDSVAVPFKPVTTSFGHGFVFWFVQWTNQGFLHTVCLRQMLWAAPNEAVSRMRRAFGAFMAYIAFPAAQPQHHTVKHLEVQMAQKAVVFILLGQSNAVGHGVPMAESDIISAPLQNVFGLSRTENQTLEPHTLVWSGYTSRGMNLGEEQDDTYSVANCLARLWQTHIDKGNRYQLPDLHIIQIAIGAQGVTEGFMWHPKREQKLIPGKLGTVDISLFPFTKQILSGVKSSLFVLGKTCETVMLHWRGGEEDMLVEEAARRKNLKGDYFELFEGFYQALGARVPTVLHKLVCKDRCFAIDPTGSAYAGLNDINEVFAQLCADYENMSLFDPALAPGYIADVPGNGIFLDDAVHYTPKVNAWVAERILDTYLTNRQSVT